MNKRPRLVLGTRNHKKRLELVDLLAPLGLELSTLADFPNSLDVVEDGHTFAGNAHRKAVQQALHLGEWVLGEDSGLVVHALGGAPGVFSARYAGPGATDEKNNIRLLEELAGVPSERRSAHYVCHPALSDPAGHIQAEAEGECHGRILSERSGSGGFGYDPLFEVVEYHRTFGQLGSVAKACLSHRSRAMRTLLPRMKWLLQSGLWQ